MSALLHCIPEVTTVGANDLSQETLMRVVAMEALPLAEMLEKQYETDAHFVQYGLASRSEPIPRLNKPILPHLRAKGDDIVYNFFAFDFDNPLHQAWDTKREEEVSAALDALKHPLNEWCAFYTTKHGYRLIYELSEPISADSGENLYAGMLHDLKQAGLDPDVSCKDWTRIFRLPKVVRDGKATQGDLIVRSGTLLNPKRISGYSDPRPFVQVEKPIEFTETDLPPLPDDIETRALLVDDKGKPTQWVLDARRKLKGRMCYGPLFEQTRLANAGQRDSTIHSFVGEACAILSTLAGSSNLLIYALFLDPILALDVDEHGDFRSRTWRAVNRYWSREQARLKAEEQEKIQQIQVQETILSRVIKGMREWCKDPRLFADDGSAAQFVSERLICCTSSHGYVINPSGYYDETALPMRLICAQVRMLGMDSLIPLQEVDKSGNVRQVNSQALIDRHGTIVRAVEGISGSPTLKGAYIRNDTLCVPLFHRRRDLPARYDREVNDWLKSLVGEDNKEMLENWIGHALAFEDGPICALSIAGPPGVGKKLLVQGLAECVSTEVAGDGKELFDEFQSHITRTPIFAINEGFPKKHGLAAGKDPADKFRSFIAGDPEMVNLKYEALMQVRNPLRLIFTANNLDVVSSLTAGRDLSPDDRAALAQRLLHIDCPEQSAAWLRAKGGLAYTAQTGRRWIRGDNGAPSDYVIAGHFMDLFETRQPVPRGNRFLVEGSLTPELLRIMAMRSGAAPLVIETLVKMVEQSRKQSPTTHIKGIVVNDVAILVTVSAIVDAFRVHMSKHTRREVEAHQVASVLKGIMRREPVMMAPEVGKRGQKANYGRWYEIDPHTLQEEAEEYGWESKILSELASKSPKRLAEADRFVRRVERALIERN